MYIVFIIFLVTGFIVKDQEVDLVVLVVIAVVDLGLDLLVIKYINLRKNLYISTFNQFPCIVFIFIFFFSKKLSKKLSKKRFVHIYLIL